MTEWTGSRTCATALDMLDCIEQARRATVNGGNAPIGYESLSMDGLESAFGEAISNWLDGLKTWLYEAKKEIGAIGASVVAALGSLKAFGQLKTARSYFNVATDILKSENGKQALQQLADPKHKSIMRRIGRLFSGGKDLTHLVTKAGQLSAAGRSNVKLAGITALMSIIFAIGIGVSADKIKSTPYAVDQILKLPLPTTKESYNVYINKITTIVAEHSYITIDGYTAGEIAKATPTLEHIEEKVAAISAISTSLKSIPARIAALTHSEAAKTPFGKKGLHFAVSFLEKMISETKALSANTAREMSHLAGDSHGSGY